MAIAGDDAAGDHCVWPSRSVEQPRVQEQLGRYIEGLGQKQPENEK